LCIRRAVLIGGSTQLEIVSNEESLIEESTFYKGKKQVHAIFGLATKIEDCRFIDPQEIGVHIESGDDHWNKANGDNSASNHSTIHECRFSGNSNNAIAIKVDDSNAILIDRNRIEGSKWGTMFHIVQGYNTTRTSMLRDNHCEAYCVNNHMYIRSKRRVKIEDHFTQHFGIWDIEAPEIKIIDPSFIKLSSEVFVANNAQRWMLYGVDANIDEPLYWKDGKRPKQLTVQNDNRVWTYSSWSMTQNDENHFTLLNYRGSDGENTGGQIQLKGYSHMKVEIDGQTRFIDLKKMDEASKLDFNKLTKLSNLDPDKLQQLIDQIGQN